MSHNVLNNLGQSPSNAPPAPNLSNLADFTALASMFQDIAQVLLRYGERSKEERSSQNEQAGQAGQIEQAEGSNLIEQVIKFCYDPAGEMTPAFSEIYADIIGEYMQGEFHEEIRCFHVSASNVRKEYELLDKYNCVNLNEFLHKTYDELSIIINLLSYLDKDVDLSATELHQVCHNLFGSLDNLQELHTHLENLQLVHKTIIPA